MEKVRLFVDMDGTLAEFKPTKKLEDLYEKGYFINLKPFPEVVEAVKKLNEDPDVEVFVLSAYLTDSEFALDEKKEWLDKNAPFIDAAHRIFCPCGTDKKLAVPNGIKLTDRLLDDYTVNLKDWEPPAVGIKLLNGINNTKGTWQGQKITRYQPPESIASLVKENLMKPIYKDFDGHKCQIIETKDVDEGRFTIGQDIEDPAFFYVEATEVNKTVFPDIRKHEVFEFHQKDKQPDFDRYLSNITDIEAERAINRFEAGPEPYKGDKDVDRL